MQWKSVGLEIDRYQVRSPLAASVVSLSKRLYPHCLVLVSTQEKKRATWKISTRLLNVLPSINKVDYYYYDYYYYHKKYSYFFPTIDCLHKNVVGMHQSICSRISRNKPGLKEG